MTEDNSDTRFEQSGGRSRLSQLYRLVTGGTIGSGGRHIYTVFVAGLVLTSVIAVGSVGVVTATDTTTTVNAGPTGNVPAVDFPPVSLEFNGCGEVWVIFRDTISSSNSVPTNATIGLSDGSSASVTITESELTTISGEYSDHPIYKFESPSGEKILNIQFEEATRTTANPNRCAGNV